MQDSEQKKLKNGEDKGKLEIKDLPNHQNKNLASFKMCFNRLALNDKM